MSVGSARRPQPVHALVATVGVWVILGSTHVGMALATEAQPDSPTMIPRPGSGVAPERATDRGGLLQFVVLLAIVVALSCIVAAVVRSSRRARVR
jgi:hypothetical protein